MKGKRRPRENKGCPLSRVYRPLEPPLVGCVVSDRNHSFAALRATRECVINIPTVELAEAVVKCGNTTGRCRDKFTAFGLAPVPASQVVAPLIAECCASIECRVVDEAPRTLHQRGRGEFAVAGRSVRLPSRKK